MHGSTLIMQLIPLRSPQWSCSFSWTHSCRMFQSFYAFSLWKRPGGQHWHMEPPERLCMSHAPPTLYIPLMLSDALAAHFRWKRLYRFTTVDFGRCKNWSPSSIRFYTIFCDQIKTSELILWIFSAPNSIWKRTIRSSCWYIADVPLRLSVRHG